jgi:hypothetical protein
VHTEEMAMWPLSQRIWYAQNQKLQTLLEAERDKESILYWNLMSEFGLS